MATRIEDLYPGRTVAASPEYPGGRAQNVTVAGDGTGTPWEEELINDWLGFFQSLLAAAGVTPNGSPDSVSNDQYLQALQALIPESGLGTQRFFTFGSISEMVSQGGPNLQLNDMIVVGSHSNLNNQAVDAALFRVVSGVPHDGGINTFALSGNSLTATRLSFVPRSVTLGEQGPNLNGRIAPLVTTQPLTTTIAANAIFRAPIPRLFFAPTATNQGFSLQANDTGGTRVAGLSAHFDLFQGTEFSFSGPNETGTVNATFFQLNTEGLFPSPLPNGLLQDLGSSTQAFDDIFATNTVIQTSDANRKEIRGVLTPQEMAAWAQVQYKVYRWKESVERKGEDARYHAGLIAQEVEAAFAAEGLDAREYGLIVVNESEQLVEVEREVERPVTAEIVQQVVSVEVIDGVPVQTTSDVSREEPVTDLVPMVDQDGNPVVDPTTNEQLTHPVPRMETVTETFEELQPTGVDEYALRYAECMCFEAAYQRGRADELEARIVALESA